MPRTSDAKSRFIATAANLFRRHGYNGVGLTQIIEAADAPKGSFYHHFPGGKEELGEEALRRATSVFSKAIDAAFTEAESYAQGMERLYEAVADWFEASDWHEGCPMTSIILDTIPGSERIHAATREACEGWIAALGGHAERFGLAGDHRALSTQALMALEGAWILARVERSREPFRQALAMVLRGL